jgi:hypothetical protein
MNTRSQIRLIWAVNVVLAATVVAAGAGFALWPVAGVGDQAADTPAPAPASPPAQARPPLSSYAVIYARDLQEPLFDAAAGERPVARPTVALAGTVVQPGNTFALLRTKAGQVQWARVGETVEGAEVTEITADSATVKFAGNTFTLKIEKQGSGP